MLNVTKYTLYGIHNTTERYSWAAYQLFVSLSSLIGDTLILYASFRRDAFKLNEFIVSVLQHIAVSDLLNAFFCFLPTGISLLTNNWILGNAMCYASFYISYWAYPTGIMFIAVMSASKFLLLKYPLRTSYWTKKRGHQGCVSIWVLCLLISSLTLIVLGKDDVKFDYRIYDCDYGFNAEASKTVVPIISIAYQFLPSCIIISTTIPTLKYLFDASKSARRVQGSIPWQGAMTVALTAIVYCISNLPLAVYFISKSYIKESPGGAFHVHFYRLIE